MSIYRCHFAAIRMPIMIWCEQINGFLSRPQNEWAEKWIDGGEMILFFFFFLREYFLNSNEPYEPNIEV